MDAQELKTYVVGIAGGSASGKSTLAAALQQTLTDGQPPLRAELYNMDRYFRREDPTAPSFISPTTGELRRSANDPDSADNPRLVADVRRRSHEADAPDVIIIEGLMALYVPLIRDILDLRLFVDLDEDIRALRRMLRGRGRTAQNPLTPEGLIGGITYYRECAKVGHNKFVYPSADYADLIVRGDADLGRVAPFVADIVRVRVAAR
jgi:uridine kinase